MKSEPQQEHQWLQKLMGEWTCEGEMPAEPGKTAETWKASESVRTLGGLWVLCEATGEMPGGGTSSSVMTLGYDPGRQRFVGTFIASMMSHLWLYEGTLDADRRELTLDAEGPSMAGDGKMAKYQDIITLVSDDERTLTSRMLGDDGKWQQVMFARYRRK